MIQEKNGPGSRASSRRSDEIRKLEADIAYLDARLAFAGRGEDNPHKRAQRRACRFLRDSLSESLETLRRK